MPARQVANKVTEVIGSEAKKRREATQAFADAERLGHATRKIAEAVMRLYFSNP